MTKFISTIDEALNSNFANEFNNILARVNSCIENAIKTDSFDYCEDRIEVDSHYSRPNGVVVNMHTSHGNIVRLCKWSEDGSECVDVELGKVEDGKFEPNEEFGCLVGLAKPKSDDTFGIVPNIEL